LIHLHELPAFPFSASSNGRHSNYINPVVVKRRQHKSVINQIIGSYSNRYTKDNIIGINNKLWRDITMRDRSETL
jgi:hypothetical protein